MKNNGIKINPPTNKKLHGVKVTRTVLVPIEQIMVSEVLRRPIDPKAVDRLARAISRSGKITPIDVVRRKTMTGATKLELCAGAHRHAACKKLGLTKVPVAILTSAQAKSWEQAENLFRHLCVLDESEAMVNYVAAEGILSEAVKQKGGKQPHDEGYSRIAKSTGWDRKRVAEAYAHDGLAQSIKQRVRGTGNLDNNRAFLTRLSKLPSLSAQRELLKKMSSTAVASQKNKRRGSNPTISPPLTVAQIRKRVTELEDVWENSPCKSVYDSQPTKVQREFLRALMY
jgi:ParB-like chromosome segregation protein Spo0J